MRFFDLVVTNPGKTLEEFPLSFLFSHQTFQGPTFPTISEHYQTQKHLPFFLDYSLGKMPSWFPYHIFKSQPPVIKTKAVFYEMAITFPPSSSILTVFIPPSLLIRPSSWLAWQFCGGWKKKWLMFAIGQVYLHVCTWI